jgi:hypothetical protein
MHLPWELDWLLYVEYWVGVANRHLQKTVDNSRVMERQALPLLPPRRQSLRLASISNPSSGNHSTIGATLSSQTDGGTPTMVRPIQAHQSTIQVNDENHVANE